MSKEKSRRAIALACAGVSAVALMTRDAGPKSYPDGFKPGTTVSRFADLAITPSSYDADAHTVEAVFSSGHRRIIWGFAEELLIAPEAIDLSRVEAGQCRLLDSHDQSTVDSVLGLVVSARVEAGKLVGKIKFGASERAKEIEARVAAGELTGLSVGYQVSTWTMIGVDNDIQIWQAQRWALYEVSLVAVPADPQAVIRSAAVTPRADARNQELDDMRRNATAAAPAATATASATMPTPAANPPAAPATRAADPAGAPPSPAPATPPASTGADLAADRVRSATILDLGRRAGMEESAIEEAIRNGTSVDAFRAAGFEVMAQRSTVAAISGATGVEITRDEQATRRTGMADAIVIRMAAANGERPQMPDHARAYAGMSLVEMAAECVGHRGHIRTARAVQDIFTRAFHTTSDFPGIFGDAANRRLLARYQAATPTFRRWAASYMATDFRPTNVIRGGDFPSLQPVNESGEIKQGTFSESKEVFRVYPYGVGLNITRTMLVNDNLGAIEQMLGSAGERVTDWENGKMYELLNANPSLLTDTTAVFHTAKHGNLASVAAAISIASVGIGRASLMKQKTLDGIKLNLAATTLLCGPDKQTEAEQLVAAIAAAEISKAVPEALKRLVPVADANIEGNPWYLFADPSVAPCFVYGSLQGFEGPRLTLGEKFGTQGIAAQLEHDFGNAAIDYRGGFKNAGA